MGSQTEGSCLSLKEVMSMFSDPSINGVCDPELKLKILFESLSSLGSVMLVMSEVASLTRGHEDYEKALSVYLSLSLSRFSD